MPYIAVDPAGDLNTVVGDGNCVAYVKKAANCPATLSWRSGARVQGNALARGTAIATFQNGAYGNHTDGRSHAAIYMSQDDTGLIVLDQWKGQVVHQRIIRFKGGRGEARNDGSAFTVIERSSLVRGLWARIVGLLRRP